MGFCTGFSHECFSLTLSGAFFVYAIFHIKTFFTKQSIPIIFLWLGTILVTASPGNFQRQGDTILHCINFIHLLPQIRIFYIFLVIVAISYVKNRATASKTTYHNGLIIWALVFSVIFGSIANSGLWSLTDIEFYAAILSLSYLCSLFHSWHWKKISVTILAGVCTVALLIHQSIIVRGQIKQHESELHAIDTYINSTDGLAVYTPPTLISLSAPWISPLPLNRWTTFSISLKYSGLSKPCTIVGNDDLDIIHGIQRLDLLIPGTAHLYKGNFHLWTTRPTDKPITITLQKLSQPIVDFFQPNKNRTFKWHVTPDAFQSGTYGHIFPYSSHQIISADFE